MNCYNGEKYLREAIESVYAQTYADWEIVLWDDASTDGTAQIAQGYDKKLKYFRGEKSVGLGHARNCAVERATGQFIAFLDQDDLWLPTKLEKQIPLFDDPEVGLVFSDVIFFNEGGKTRRMYDDIEYCTGYCFPQLLCQYFLSIATVVIRRSALDTLDSWFEPRFSLCEEADLFIRISYSWKIAMKEEPLSKWRVHSSSLTWQMNERATAERESYLAKYRRTIPDFTQKYSREIRVFETSNSVSKAKNLWKSQKTREARDCLVQFMFRDLKAFVMYWITFLPPKAVFWTLSKLRSTIYPA
jgi:glycosyltransferase involved in cell wall biosynthesis